MEIVIQATMEIVIQATIEMLLVNEIHEHRASDYSAIVAQKSQTYSMTWALVTNKLHGYFPSNSYTALLFFIND